MDKEEFHAVIKLVSGEEIFAKVCPCEEEDKTILILDCPVTFENIIIRQIGVSAVRINPWLKISDDPTVVMNMDKVITMTEVHDKHLIKVYNKYLNEKDQISNRTDINENMGFLSSVSDARVFLEKLYKSS
tara:strand:+ start:2566 stop:2958 length:393 start_codon:yes stop_codon:yes gene_type:complete